MERRPCGNALSLHPLESKILASYVLMDQSLESAETKTARGVDVAVLDIRGLTNRRCARCGRGKTLCQRTAE